ncbi:dynamin family protein [Pontibacillus yanchengensis]|uniref:Dynamin N-terminal domain-containing protein n=1 Tax=Pontibacillus yanchengensis Y32 TaxID=1385514 RepID=A0A0A2TZH9_9BACI|nr:dynamin family protein [Pontibacillus yanchengensis]KGP74675.1 hypothetical protein N782_00385 [Pontibacillus yanchengensis Y32]
MSWVHTLQTELEKLYDWLENNTHTDKILPEVEQLKENLHENKTILIAGEFNSGKSTFINALLQEEKLSVDIVPATAVLTKLTYGEHTTLYGYYKNGAKAHFSIEDLPSLSSEKQGDLTTIRNQLSYIELQLPNPLLKNLTIIDSPGLNSGHEHHEMVTKTNLNQADVAFWLFHYQHTGTEQETHNIKMLQEYNIPTYGIINAIDLHNEEEEELEDFIDFNMRRLQSFFTHVIGVSAKEALDAKINGDEELLYYSNWERIDTLINSIINDHTLKKESMYKKYINLLSHLYQELLQQKDTLKTNYYENIVENFMLRDYPYIEEFYVNTLERKKQLENEVHGLRKQLPSSPIQSYDYLEEMYNFIASYSRATKVNLLYLETQQKNLYLFSSLLKDLNKSIRKYNKQMLKNKERKKYIEIKWNDLNNRKWPEKSDIKHFIDEQLQYNKKIGGQDSDYERINSKKKELRKYLISIRENNNSQLQKLIQHYHNNLNSLYYEYYNTLASHISNNDIHNVNSIKNIEIFYEDLQKLLRILEIPDTHIQQASSYKKLENIYQCINNVYKPNSPLSSFVKYYEKYFNIQLTSLSNDSPIVEISQTHFLETIEEPLEKMDYQTDELYNKKDRIEKIIIGSVVWFIIISFWILTIIMALLDI